jgi:hypothetical protein
MNPYIAGLVALLVLLAGSEPASAEPISLSLIAFATGTTYAAAAAAYAGTFLLAATTFIVSSVLGMGLSYLSALLMKKPGAGVGGTTGKLQIGGVVPRSFPLGAATVVSHSLAYANTFGSEGKTPNAFLVSVMPLADIPCPGGLSELWVNGTKVTWNPAATPSTEGIAIPEFNKGGKDHLWIRLYDGTQTAVDSRLYDLFGADADRPYDSDRIGTGVVYAVATVRWNRDVWGGMPSYKFVLSGIPLYDVRKDSSAGGSGSHRWSDPSTWEPSSNPMVQIYCIIRGLPYAGEWFFGGQTVSARQLPVAEWSAAMNECDVLIPLAGGGSEKQYRSNGEIRLDMEPADVVKDLLTACNGRLAEIGGVYKPWVGAAGVAVFSITDDDILSTAAQTFVPFKSLAEQVNGATGKYVEPAEGWTAKDASPYFVPDLEAEDGGRRQTVDVGYSYVTSGTQVQRLMKSAVLEARRERSHQLPLPPDAYPLEPNDFISWTSARNGYTNKLFRVDAAQDMANLTVGLSIVEVDPADYDWDETTDEQPIVIAPTPRVDVPAQAFVDWDADPVTVTGADGRAKAGIRLTWNPNDLDDIEGIEYQVRLLGETSNLVTHGFFTQPELGILDITANVVAATNYQARGRYKPFSGRETLWSSWVTVTTPDVRVDIIELSTRLNAQFALTTTALQSLQQSLDLLGGAVSSIESVTTTENFERVERANRISASLGAANAAITTLQTVTAATDVALAALETTVEANYNDLSAGGIFKIEAVATPPAGAASGFQMLAYAQDQGGFAQAGIKAYARAGGGGTPTGFASLVGDQIYREPAGGGPPVLMVDSNGRFITDGIADGAISGRGVVNQTTSVRADRNSYDASTTWQTIGSFTLANKVANSSVLVQAYIYAKHDSGTLWMPSTPSNIIQLYKVRLARVGTASTPLEFSDQISQVTYSNSGVTYWDRRGAAALAVFDQDTSVSGSQTYEIQIKLTQTYPNGYTIAYGGGGYPITTYAVPNAVSAVNGPNLTYEFSATGFYLELKK